MKVVEIKKTKWHKVKILPDSKGPFGVPAMSRAYLEQVEKWIIDQVQNNNFYIWIHFGSGEFGFKREEDAMAFKLRWL